MSTLILRRGIPPLLAAALSGIVALVVLAALGIGDRGNSPSKHTVASIVAERSMASRHYSEVDAIRQGDAPPGAPPNPEDTPIPANAFKEPVAQYLRYSAVQLKRLTPELERLQAAIGSHDRAQAERAWLSAFAGYLHLGAVYGAFGSLNQEIDGTPGGLPRGTADPGFSGFHRIEFGLWSGQALSSLEPLVRRLRRDVIRLRRTLPSARITPLEYATRVHEILEDAQRDFLSGNDVPWSGAGVLATAAGLTATEETLSTLTPVLDGQSGLGPVRYRLTQLAGVLARLRTSGGSWPSLSALSTAERERLNGALSGALLALSALPGELETQLPPAIPALKQNHR